MIRRKFFGLFAALPFVKIAPAVSSTNNHISELISATIGNRQTGLAALVTRQNALLSHIKSVGGISREPLLYWHKQEEPSPMWRLGVE